MSTKSGLKSFMVENVPIRRSDLYVLRFLYFLFMVPALLFAGGDVALGQRGPVLIIALVASIVISAVYYWRDRHGPLSDRTSIILSLVVLAILALVVWRGLQRHKHDVPIDSKPYPTSTP